MPSDESRGMAVPMGTIVKHFDVSEDIRIGHSIGHVGPVLDSLSFPAAEDELGNGIVPTVTPSAHSGLEVVSVTKSLPVVAALL